MLPSAEKWRSLTRPSSALWNTSQWSALTNSSCLRLSKPYPILQMHRAKFLAQASLHGSLKKIGGQSRFPPSSLTSFLTWKKKLKQTWTKCNRPCSTTATPCARSVTVARSTLPPTCTMRISTTFRSSAKNNPMPKILRLLRKILHSISANRLMVNLLPSTLRNETFPQINSSLSERFVFLQKTCLLLRNWTKSTSGSKSKH